MHFLKRVFSGDNRKSGGQRPAPVIKPGVFCDMRGTFSREVLGVLEECVKHDVPVTLFSSGVFAPHFSLPDFLPAKILRKDAFRGKTLAIVIDDTSPARQGLHALRWIRPGDKKELSRLHDDPRAYLREVLGEKDPSTSHGQTAEMRPGL